MGPFSKTLLFTIIIIGLAVLVSIPFMLVYDGLKEKNLIMFTIGVFFILTMLAMFFDYLLGY